MDNYNRGNNGYGAQVGSNSRGWQEHARGQQERQRRLDQEQQQRNNNQPKYPNQGQSNRQSAQSGQGSVRKNAATPQYYAGNHEDPGPQIKRGIMIYVTFVISWIVYYTYFYQGSSGLSGLGLFMLLIAGILFTYFSLVFIPIIWFILQALLSLVKKISAGIGSLIAAIFTNERSKKIFSYFRRSSLSSTNTKPEEPAQKSIIQCPRCKQSMRVPSNRGMIKVKCVSCPEEFMWTAKI